MADTTTTTYGLTKPEVGASEDTWGEKLNTNLDSLDDLLSGGITLQGAKLDDTTRIVDNADATKIVALSAGSLTTATTRTFTFPDASGTFVLADNTVTLTNKTLNNPVITGTLSTAGTIFHTGDTGTNIDFTTGNITVNVGATSRLNVNSSGMRLSATSTRVTTILDEDTMSSNSATALATQQSIKAYVDSVPAPIQAYVDSVPTPVKAYVNFNGSAVGLTERGVSSGFSSLTDLGTGYYRATFTEVHPDNGWCGHIMQNGSNADPGAVLVGVNTETAYVEFKTINDWAVQDKTVICVTVVGV